MPLKNIQKGTNFLKIRGSQPCRFGTEFPINEANTEFCTFSSHTEYVKRESIVIA